MVFFIALFGIVLCITLCYWWLKAIGAFFRLFEPKENPYVKVHQAKLKNDKTYQDYLEWLDKTGGDIPLDKWKTKEEMDFEKKVERANTEHEIRNMFKGGKN